MLEPEGLQCFIAIAEELNFVRAADRLGLAQSVVSKRLMRLEDQLGTRLVSRNRRRKVDLTREGAQFLPAARAVLQHLESVELRGRRIASGEAGAIRIGYVFSAIMTGILPSLIRTLKSAAPELHIIPLAMETPEQIAAIGSERLDVALVRPRPSYPAGVLARRVHREAVLLALANDNRLASHPRIACAHLRDMPFIIPQFHEDVGLIDVIKGIVRIGRLPEPKTIYTRDFITAAGLAVAGMGIAPVPKSLQSLAISGLGYRPVIDLDVSLDLMLLSRPDLPALIVAALGS